MPSMIQSSLNLFVAAAILAAFAQDIYTMTVGSSSVPSSQPTPTSSEQPSDEKIASSDNTASAQPSYEQGILNGTDPIPQPYLEGVTIYVTDNLRKQLMDFLVAQKYTIKTESYKFQGQEWWIENAITYGHMIIVYILMGKYKTETNEATKKKIMYLGGAFIILWMFLSPNLKQSRISIEVNGAKVYTKDELIGNQIVSAIADELDVQKIVADDIQEQYEF